MEILITNQQSRVKYHPGLESVIVKVIEAAVRLQNLGEDTEVSVLLVDNDYIQELNLLYREQNQATDVLSFALNEKTEDEPDLELAGEPNVLGDIVISLEKAETQSKEYGHSLERELGFLVVHGMLHLLGFDHDNEDQEKAMLEQQEIILRSVNLER